MWLFTQSCLTVCNPMDCGTSCPSPSPWVWSLMSIESVITISSSVTPFSSCPQSFPASGSFPVNQLFTSDSQSIGTSSSDSASVLQLIFRVDFIWNRLVSSPCCTRDSNESSPAHLKNINFSALSLLGDPTLTSTRDYWKKLWLDGLLLAKWCLCFLIFCLGLS